MIRKVNFWLIACIVIGLIIFWVASWDAVKQESLCNQLQRTAKTIEFISYLDAFVPELIENQDYWNDLSMATSRRSGELFNHPLVESFGFQWEEFNSVKRHFGIELVGSIDKIDYQDFEVDEVAQLRISIDRTVLLINLLDEGENIEQQNWRDAQHPSFKKISSRISTLCWEK